MFPNSFVDPLLDLDVAPVPAGTEADPGIYACVSPNINSTFVFVDTDGTSSPAPSSSTP